MSLMHRKRQGGFLAPHGRSAAGTARTLDGRQRRYRTRAQRLRLGGDDLEPLREEGGA